MISLIFGISRNHIIGQNNKLPWHIPADLAYFKRVTLGHPVVMGRKTYESIGKPLPGRNNIIITRDESFSADGCTICRSINEVLELASDGEIFIIGGAEIYRQFMPFADKMYITFIDADVDGDTLLEDIDYRAWDLISQQPGVKDEKNPYDYKFLVYKKK